MDEAIPVLISGLRKGITLNSQNHGQHTFHPHRGMSNIHDPNQIILLITQLVVKSVAEISPVDYIVCAHKAIDQDEVAALLQPAIDSRTTIVVIQNGVGNEEPFRKRFPDNPIITCVVRSLHIVNSSLVLTSTDVGRSHADKSWDCLAHQIRGYADRLIP